MYMGMATDGEKRGEEMSVADPAFTRSCEDEDKEKHQTGPVDVRVYCVYFVI